MYRDEAITLFTPLQEIPRDVSCTATSNRQPESSIYWSISFRIAPKLGRETCRAICSLEFFEAKTKAELGKLSSPCALFPKTVL